jgi:hypothetical protein
MATRRHAQILGLVGLKTTLGTRNRLIFIVFKTFPLDVILAVAHFATQTRILAGLVARQALVRLRVQHLARRLMFKLVVFAQKRIAEATLENPTAMVPYTTLALDTDSVLQWTTAGMRLQTFSAVTHPRLAKVTNSANHLHAYGEHTNMFDDTVASFQHALDFRAVGTHWQSLNRLAEVTKGTILLLLFASVTFHDGVARKFN